MADFPKKYLPYIPSSISGDVDVALEDFDAALAARKRSVNNTTVFMPKMSAITSNSVCNVTVNTDTATTGLKVYKLNKPGFFYYQHWKGLWTPRGWVQILVCKHADFKSSQVYELLNTQDNSSGGNSGGNDHTNNLFPMNPGSSTYVLLRGTFASQAGKAMFYVPAWTGTSDSATNAIVVQTAGVNLPSSVVSGAANDDGFKACFA